MNKLHEIGSGSFGEVYTNIEEPGIAIKILCRCYDIYYSDISGLYKNFLMECNVLTILKNNKNIVQLNRINIENKKKIYLELHNMDLDKYMSNHIKNYNIVLIAKKLFVQLSLGLYAIHKYNFVHADIKPSNILVKINDGNVTFAITDFGNCVFYRSDKVYLNIIGTSGYIPPECMKYRNLPIDITQKIDVFSAGCCFYDYFYCLDILDIFDLYSTKKFGFTELYPQNINTEFLLKRAAISNRIYEFMNNCLKINPNERYSSGDMCDYLNILPVTVQPKIVNLARGKFKCTSDTTLKMINIVQEWITHLSKQIKFMFGTTLLGLDIIQRITHNYEIKKEELQLCGCVCLHLSSKFLEEYSLEIQEYIYYSDYSFTKNQFIEMEKNFAIYLNYVIYCDEFGIFVKEIDNKLNNDKILKLYTNFLNNNIDAGNISYNDEIWFLKQ